MNTILKLEKLTRAEKLRAMEELWADLSRPQEEYDSPVWHGGVLEARETAVEAGEDEYVPWEDAKKVLRERKK